MGQAQYLADQLYSLDPESSTSPHFSPVREMIAQEIVFTRDFVTERNSRAYFRAKKIPCGNKDQARARVAGEKCGLGRHRVLPRACVSNRFQLRLDQW